MNTFFDLINAPLFQSLILSPVAGIVFGFWLDGPRRRNEQKLQYLLAQTTGNISMGDMLVDGNGNSIRLNSPDMSTYITQNHSKASQNENDARSDAFAFFGGAAGAILFAVAGYIYFFDTILRLVPLAAIFSGTAAVTISALRTFRGSANFVIVIIGIVSAAIAYILSNEASILMHDAMDPSAKELLIRMRFQFFLKGGEYIGWTALQVLGTICLLCALVFQVIPPMQSKTILKHIAYFVFPVLTAVAAYFILNGDLYRYLHAHPI